MNQSLYYMGDGHSKYGIYNKAKKEFQFGICEDTPMLAEARLYQRIGLDAMKWKFEVRRMPNADKGKSSAKAQRNVDCNAGGIGR